MNSNCYLQERQDALEFCGLRTLRFLCLKFSAPNSSFVKPGPWRFPLLAHFNGKPRVWVLLQSSIFWNFPFKYLARLNKSPLSGVTCSFNWPTGDVSTAWAQALPNSSISTPALACWVLGLQFCPIEPSPTLCWSLSCALQVIVSLEEWPDRSKSPLSKSHFSHLRFQSNFCFAAESSIC